MALEWLERLRPASFVSPSGIESFFKLDVLNRVGGKKASIHEILNKNEAIPQDQGNRSKTYSIEAFFTGGNGDLEADAYFDSLHEQYSISSPGILKHPVWGDINVMPFDIQQSTNLVIGAGIFRVPVTFREIPASLFPTTEGVDQSEIVADITDLESIVEEANSSILVDAVALYADFRAKINEVVGVVGDAIGAVAATVDDVEDEFRKIQADIDSALALASSAIEIMSQVNNLIRLPGQIIDSTIGKIEAFASMVTGISLSFVDAFNPKADRQTNLNKAIMFQSLTAIAAVATSEAALFTEFETRDAASEALDFVNDAAIVSEQGSSEISQTLSGGVTAVFLPDHNTGLGLSLITGKTNAILINRSFDLKAKQTEILTAPSDAITLTWKFYKDMDKLDFFIRTNNLQDNDFLEIASGREVVAYV